MGSSASRTARRTERAAASRTTQFRGRLRLYERELFPRSERAARRAHRRRARRPVHDRRVLSVVRAARRAEHRVRPSSLDTSGARAPRRPLLTGQCDPRRKDPDAVRAAVRRPTRSSSATSCVRPGGRRAEIVARVRAERTRVRAPSRHPHPVLCCTAKIPARARRRRTRRCARSRRIYREGRIPAPDAGDSLGPDLQLGRARSGDDRRVATARCSQRVVLETLPSGRRRRRSSGARRPTRKWRERDPRTRSW